MTRSATPVPAHTPRQRLAVRAIAYVVAVVIGLGLLPTAFSFADRATVLRVSNDLLDLVGR